MWNVDRYYYLDIHTPDTVDIDIVLRVYQDQGIATDYTEQSALT